MKDNEVIGYKEGSEIVKLMNESRVIFACLIA